ncbi:thioredoxin family protein [Candidatus Bathyarchaeota archaeon]|nr:thioredoxin family protein [Candidatus Bathyarchaeota archaeon]
MTNYVEADADTWNREVEKADILTVVYFWHDECPWCLRLNPIFNEVSQEYAGRIKFVKLNIMVNQANREIAANHGVMSTPTLVFFCHRRPVGQSVGFMPKEQLEKSLADVLQRYKTCLSQSTELRPFYIV